jgi:hypothetical protein
VESRALRYFRNRRRKFLAEKALTATTSFDQVACVQASGTIAIINLRSWGRWLVAGFYAVRINDKRPLTFARCHYEVGAEIAQTRIEFLGSGGSMIDGLRRKCRSAGRPKAGSLPPDPAQSAKVVVGRGEPIFQEAAREFDIDFSRQKVWIRPNDV